MTVHNRNGLVSVVDFFCVPSTQQLLHPALHTAYPAIAYTLGCIQETLGILEEVKVGVSASACAA